MNNPLTETAQRVAGGYLYRGHFLERCPGNQWNVYDVEDRTYPDGCVAEGCASLREAKTTVDRLVIPQTETGVIEEVALVPEQISKESE